MDRLSGARGAPGGSEPPAGGAREVLSGALLAAVALAYGAGALGIPGGRGSEPGPRVFPLALAAMLAVAGAWIAVAGMRAARAARAAGAPSPGPRAPVAAAPWVAALATTAYAALLEPLGFWIGTLAYAAAVTALFTSDRRYLIAVPLGVAAALYAFFGLALGVRLPAGLLG